MGVLDEFRGVEGAEVTCASDANGPLLAKVRELGIKKTHRSHEALLSKEEIDAVIVYTENSRHADITELAAEKGLHVMVEKPMSANLEQAERMLKASRKHGIKLMINYPTAWYPTFRGAYKLADEGLVGKIY